MSKASKATGGPAAVTAGIDVGSKTIKVAVLRGGELLASAIGTGGFEQREASSRLLERALAQAGVPRGEVAHVTATGAGRNAVDFADSRVTHISAAGRAANHYFPGVTTVVEVGAEESRAVKTDGAGRVLDSAVNEKCAAGSGSFAESMARALGMELSEFAERSLESDVKIPMNAQCTVFAESEVVSLIHQNVAKKDICRAVHDAIASRVGSLARRVRIEGEVALLGGLAYNAGFRRSLMENLTLDRLLIPERPDFADAVGAALIAADRAAGRGEGEGASR